MMMFNTIFAVDDDLLMRGLQLSFLSKQLELVSSFPPARARDRESPAQHSHTRKLLPCPAETA